MKAVLVTERFPPQRGGVGVSARRLARGLVPHLERLEVVHLTADLPAGTVASREEDGFTVSAVGRGRSEDESLQILELVLRTKRADVVHAFYASGVAVAALLAAEGARTVVSVRGNDVDRGIYQKGCGGLLWALGRADRVLCVSRASQRRVAFLTGRGDVRYVPNAVDAAVFRPQPADAALRATLGAAPLLLFSGEMRAKKGMSALLAAVDGIPGTLILAGGVRRDDAAPYAAWRTASPQAARRVVEVPYARDADRLRALYNACDLVVLPSLWEGMPNAALEAMACARPVLGTRAGGLEDLLIDGETGFALDVTELDALAHHVHRALAAPSTGERARAFVREHHSLEREVTSVLDAYRD